MNLKLLIPSILLLLSTSQATAACGAIRFGYPDQHRPPYWMGNGIVVADPPGASVEWVREFAATADCSVDFVRLPVPRLRSSLASGAVDFTTVDITADGQPGILIPRNAAGKPDTKRAATLAVVTFVRAKDGHARNADPLPQLRGQRVGVMYGSSYTNTLQQAGALLDQGAPTVPSNFEKLHLGRIDAFAVAVVSESDLDNFVATRYKGDIVRLEKPILKSFIWLATNQRYYNAHRAEVEAMWNWLGADGNKRYNALLRKYTEN